MAPLLLSLAEKKLKMIEAFAKLDKKAIFFGH
jgi:hypothetical protein